MEQIRQGVRAAINFINTNLDILSASLSLVALNGPNTKESSITN